MLHLNGSPLNVVDSYKYLGITLDKYMNLTGLILNVKKLVSLQLFKSGKIGKYITFYGAISIYKLDYTGFLFNS